MNNIIQTIQHTARAAAVLLIALCAAQTAWAESPAIDPAHFSVNDAGTEYTIHTATGWDYFCDLLAENDKGIFTDKTVRLGANITVTRMAGGSYHDFTGTFDGQGNTLTFNYGEADKYSTESYVAPFRNVESSCIIKNLHVAGDIYTSGQYAAGVICSQYGTVTIRNCRSSINIHSSHGGDGIHGGLVANNNTYGNLTIEGCLFDGKILTTGATATTHCGGFVGWRANAVTITNSLYAPAALEDGETEVLPGDGDFPSATFARNGATITNCYYTRTLGDAQGKQARSISKGAYITDFNISGTATQYTVSGITAYATGIKYGGVLYAGSGDNVSLTLANNAGVTPQGYQDIYTASPGTISGSANPYTLTMPDADVTIAFSRQVLPWSGDGTEDNPFLIEYPSQLDLLAYRVKGTHGETRQDDGYSGKYFKLNNDISYTHTSAWNDYTSDENNYEAIGGYHNGSDRSFCGHFDGNSKTISGIRIYRGGKSYADNYQGIFGQTGDGADIHDLTLADARITGHDYTGGIVGDNRGTVARCHVAGDVAVCAVQSDAWYHGGIVGDNSGTIEQCTSAATLTIADASNCKYYGGIAGRNEYGTMRDNLAIGATVPAAADNTYGAITGRYVGTLQRNYYTACNVANVENATGVGSHNADVTANGGAVSIHTLTLADGITTTTPVTITIGTTGYYAQGTAIALSYSGTPTGDTPAGYQYGYTASASTINGSTLTMPAEDVTVSVNTAILISTHEAVEVSYVDAGGTPQTAQAIALDGTETDLGTDGNETWYFVGLPTVAFDHMLNLNGNVHLILADGCTMNVTSSNDIGIYVDGSLTIYGQTDGTGTLNATGFLAGIITGSGNITISGGTVTATGGDGIFTLSGTITISGGTVTVTGGNYGIQSDSGDITISGGRVTITGENAAGIYTDSGTITLGCTTASDFIYVNSYLVDSEGTLNIADGQTLFDEDSNPYSGDAVIIPNGKTLRLSPGIALTAREAPDGNYWTTYYNSALGFTIDEDEHACAYTATYGGSQLTLHNLGKEIPAGTAVIIVADNGVVSMTATTDLPAYSGTNDLRGVDVDTDVDDITSDLGDGTLYVLGMTTVNNEQHFGFHRYMGEEMAAHKAFVHVASSPSQSARSLTMVFDDATAIEGLTPAAAPQSQAADHWFTLDGRRLQAKPTAPGIYVNNGRKVVIK